MSGIIVKRIALLSFICFFIVILKIFLINALQLVPVYSSASRRISWLGILPITIIGVVSSVFVISIKYQAYRKNGGRIWNADLLFSLPMLLYVVLIMSCLFIEIALRISQ